MNLNNNVRRRSISVGEASLGFSYRIDSKMNTPVVVKTRAGVNYRLPTPVNHTSRKEYVRVVYEVVMSNDVLFYLTSELGSSEVNKNLIRLILDACDGVKPGGWLGTGKEIHVELKIDREMLNNAGGSLYIDFLDMEICIDPGKFDSPHRESIGAIKERVLAEIIEEQAQLSVCKGVVLVDSQRRLDRRFISLNNEVVELTPAGVSTAYPTDGCYFINIKPGVTKTEQITFINMDELLADGTGDVHGLYRSREAAIAKGNTRELRDQRKKIGVLETQNAELTQTINDERRTHARKVDDLTDRHRKDINQRDDKISELTLKLSGEQVARKTQKDVELLKQESERHKDLLNELSSVRANCDKEHGKVMRSLLGGPGGFLKQCVGLLHTLL